MYSLSARRVGRRCFHPGALLYGRQLRSSTDSSAAGFTSQRPPLPRGTPRGGGGALLIKDYLSLPTFFGTLS